MTEKKPSSIKILIGKYTRILIFCGVLMAGTFWSIAGSLSKADGAGMTILVLVVIASLGTGFLLYRSLDQDDTGSDDKQP